MGRTFQDSVDADLESVFYSTDEFAVTVSITRGENTTAGVATYKMARAYDVANEYGVLTAYESVDFDFIASTYQIDGSETDPISGDRIVVGDNTYQALPIPGKECFEPIGDGSEIRVHTKRVA